MIKPNFQVKDIKEIEKDCPDYIQAAPNGDELFYWKASILGPAGTPYEGGVFRLDVHIPSTYPFCPPQIRFIKPIFHVNISSSGLVCLDILKGRWSPMLSILKGK